MTALCISAAEAYPLLADGKAPAHLTVKGLLDYSPKSRRPLPTTFPEFLTVDVLNLSGTEVTTLPATLKCYELNLSQTPITSFPDGVQVESRLVLTGCERLTELPKGLTVGTLVLRGCTSLTRLPEELDVWFLDMTGCGAFETWPRKANIRNGHLQLRGCTAMQALPSYLQRLAALNVQDCPQLTALPPDLVITGWLELGHSGLTDESMLPSGLDQTSLRWVGVNVDRRILFRPETIEVGEVLGEQNAERRRVLLDRYGYGRFLKDAKAQVLDRDTDPGGPRELLRVGWEDDEDLVALSCFCPSTGRQYVIRVPPTTSTCRHAAAWIAGFDDPDDYNPILET